MITGPLRLYAPACHAILSGTTRLERVRLAAVLLDAGHVPDFTAHTRFSDIAGYALSGRDARPVALAGPRVETVPGGAAFYTDPAIWPAPSDLPPVRYLAFVEGYADALDMDAPLFGLIDLRPEGGAVEAQRGSLSISPGADGWFAFTTDSNPE